MRHAEFAADLGHAVEALGGKFDRLVFHQAPHELGARIFFLFDLGRLRQQHARLDFDQHGRHQQIVGGKFELEVLGRCAHLVDVVHVLPRQLGHGDIEDIEVVLADQVEQQVERAFKSLEVYLERIGRDIEILRQLGNRLAADARTDRRLDHDARRFTSN